MNDTIFDLVEGKAPEGKTGYFDVAAKAPMPKDNSFFESVKDYGRTILKGSAEGLAKFGTMMNPIPYQRKPIQQQHEEYTQSLNEMLPTDEGGVQRGLRRGLAQAPTAMGLPGAGLATLPRAIAAGFLGEGAKDLGAPEWAQTALELTAYVGPDVTKKLLEKGSNAELISAGRRLGLSDEALTPLLQSDFKQKWLSKITPRRGATAEALEKSKSGLQESYGKIAESEEAKKLLSPEASQKLAGVLEDKLFKMPSGVREKVSADYKDLLKGPINGESLINFWSDINHAMGPNSKQLSLLKEPIKQALAETSPSMAKDFETINKLYTKFYPIAKKLEPNLKTDIMGAAKALGFLGGLITGDYVTLSQFGTPEVLGRISQQLLLNPRFQQLSQKMVIALNQHKYAMAEKLVQLYKREIKKISPEAADQIEDLKEEDFIKLLSHHKRT